MKYFSLNHKAPKVTFKEAVINGLAPDKGLYYPERLKKLPASFFDTIENLDYSSIAYEAIQPFIGEDISEKDLKSILKESLNFNFPIVDVEDNIKALELYHGPTMAFKDVGARFMARCLGHFNQYHTEEKITVLVATSGDTGGAVANGFLGVKGISVVILYPSGKVRMSRRNNLPLWGKTSLRLK